MFAETAAETEGSGRCRGTYRHRSFSSRASHCAFTPSSPCTSHLHTPAAICSPDSLARKPSQSVVHYSSPSAIISALGLMRVFRCNNQGCYMYGIMCLASANTFPP